MNFGNFLRFWLVTYPAAWLFFLIFKFLEIIGHIKIVGKENFPKAQRGVFVVSNHPSFYEATALNFLLFPSALWHPLRLMPYNLPDKKNFHGGWRKVTWSLVSSQFIYVARDPKDHEKVLNSMEVYRNILYIHEHGNPIIIFPEGGRTSSVQSGHMVSPLGNRIRMFSDTVARITVIQGGVIVPIWVSNAEKALPRGRWFPKLREPLIIKIGECVKMKPCYGNSREIIKELNTSIMQKVLSLGDSLES